MQVVYFLYQYFRYWLGPNPHESIHRPGEVAILDKDRHTILNFGLALFLRQRLFDCRGFVLGT